MYQTVAGLTSEVFEQLAERHRRSIYRRMLRVCGNRDDAEDAVAEALLSAFRVAETLRDEEGFRSWVVTTGTRSHLRRRRKEAVTLTVPLDEVAEVTSPPRHDIDLLLAQWRRLVESLPPSMRDVYVLVAIEELSIEEAAIRLGMTITSVQSRYFRAKALVKRFAELAMVTII